MKKLLVFFILIIFNFAIISFFDVKNTNKCYGIENAKVVYNNVEYELDLSNNENVTALRQSVNKLSTFEQLKIINKVQSMGFSLEEAINYVYPNFESSIKNLCDIINVQPQEPTVFAEYNNCKINFKNAKNGVKVDKNALYCDFYDYLCDNTKLIIKTTQTYPQKTLQQVKDDFVLVASFETSFATSGDSRKNNIDIACKAINGKIIKSGEVFSFNKATGERSELNGYKQAKIIKDGEYIDGFGGGVCQVSSTLYNVCLLAGLKATEVHNHTLPTGYVKPCFDAMVNMGSSDLKIKNDTPYDYIITCSTNNNICKIALYGVVGDYKIVTRYEKYEEIPAKDVIDTDVGKYGEYPVGEHRISNGIPGYRAKGYLDYYKDGVLIKSEIIRDNTYNPKNGVILVVE